MGGLAEFFRVLGPSRLAAMGAVAVGLVGIFVFLALRFSAPQMATLFTELPVEDSGAVVRALETQNIPYELKNEGATILVPKEQVLRVRMTLAEDGLPAGGSVGYEIFDKGDTLGATSFVQNLNHLRALEGELARTIRALERVQLARVHLVLPKRQLFSQEKSEPSASIVLKLRGQIDKGQIRAIQYLVATAVKDLKPARVSIVDETGALLASGIGDDAGTGLANSMEERSIAYERRLEEQVEEIISSVVGPGKARVQVSAEIDYNRITQTSETFDPDGQVVRSTQTREESANSSAGGGGDSVSVGNELPGADDAGQGDKSANKENSNKTEEVVNYEISRTSKTEVIEAGRIKRLSVAVLVDGIYDTANQNNPAYQPRPQEQLDQIASLVRSAIGFNKDRGDQVEVVNMRFAPPVAGEQLKAEEEPFLNLSKQDYFYIAELTILLILAILVLLFIVRPLIRRIITPEDQAALTEAGAAGAIAGAAGTGEDGEAGAAAQIEGPQGGDAASQEAVRALVDAGENRTAQLIDVAQVAGEMHGLTVKKVGDLILGNPDEAVAIIRQWLQDKAA